MLKKRELEHGVDLSTNCRQLKMPAHDGKMRLTDVATTKQLLRIIQSVPSPKAEPFKQWLAQVGSERLDEIADPEIAIERAVSTYRQKGYSEEWISQRIRSIEIRNDLTAEWNEYKEYKGLKKEGLRDNMTNMELVLNMLAEVSTTEISKVENPEGFYESRDVAQRGGNIAGNARREIENVTGKKVVSPHNAKDKKLLG